MEKNIEYYISLPYRAEIIPIPEELGGGYTARLPEIGHYAITGDGETQEEALQNLEAAKRSRFEDYLARGIEIAEPDPVRDEYSGRFVVRIPKVLHRQLSEAAKANQASLNHYVTYLLSTNFQLSESQTYLSEISEAISCVSEAIWDIGYSVSMIPEGKPYEEFEKELQDNRITQIALLKAA